MLARRALERRRAAIAGGIAASIAGFTLASRYSDQQRRPLQGCEADTVSAAISSLKTSGVSVMRDLIDQETLTAVQASSVYKDMPMTMPSRAGHARSHAGGARRDGTSAGVPVQSAWRASAMGRLHRREESFDDSDQKVFERVEKLIWPLVKAFFEEGGEQSMQGIYRSEMQILNAVPGSKDQTWHSDNQSRGLSIIVPLVDFSAENGATQLLLGSHTSSWPLAVQQGAQVVQAPVGSVAAYDSRTYHRGLGNQTAEGRPALIFCYDKKTSPPPGCGTAGSIANANLAHVLNMASTARNVCASWAVSSG
jgi:hypothetical protein